MALVLSSCAGRRVRGCFVVGTHATFVAESDGESADGEAFVWHDMVRFDIMAPFGKRLAVYVQGKEGAILIVPKERKVYISESIPTKDPKCLLKRGNFVLKVGNRRIKIKVTGLDKGFEIPCYTFNPKVPQDYRKVRVRTLSIKIL